MYERWSKSEKAAARWAFEKANQREHAALIRQVQKRAKTISNPQDLWQLRDFLNKKLKEMNSKYDYRYSMLTFVFARLLKEGWLEESDLTGLGEDKMAQIFAVLEIAKN